VKYLQQIYFCSWVYYCYHICRDWTVCRKESVSASVAMEHMIPDLLISEKVCVWTMFIIYFCTR